MSAEECLFEIYRLSLHLVFVCLIAQSTEQRSREASQACKLIYWPPDPFSRTEYVPAARQGRLHGREQEIVEAEAGKQQRRRCGTQAQPTVSKRRVG